MYFDRRCNDLTKNQGRIINGLLECSKRKIKLDKVLMEDGSLSVDEEEIKRVNRHFSTIALTDASLTNNIPQVTIL